MLYSIPRLFSWDGQEITLTLYRNTAMLDRMIKIFPPEFERGRGFIDLKTESWLTALTWAGEVLGRMNPVDTPTLLTYQLDLCLFYTNVWREGMNRQSPFHLPDEVSCLEHADIEAREVVNAIRRATYSEPRNDKSRWNIDDEVADTMAMLMSAFLYANHFAFTSYSVERICQERDRISVSLARSSLRRQLCYATTGALKRAEGQLEAASWLPSGLTGILICIEMLKERTFPTYLRCLNRWAQRWHPERQIQPFEVEQHAVPA